jgi:SAD/SRA domain
MRMIEDLTIIANKWARGDFSIRPSRGLCRRGHYGRFWPDRDYDLRRSAAFFGHNGLVNGQMWATRSEMYRDGAHGLLIGGIHGSKALGVYAVVMGYHNPSKGEYYADIDCGETIWYISTALPKRPGMGDDNIRDNPDELVHFDPELATDGAQALIKSHVTKVPVRVIRSFKAAQIVKYRPNRGYRYDGLYRVVDYELLKADRQIYRFKMTRVNEREGEYVQGPLRSAGHGPRDGNLPERPRRRRRREEGDGLGGTSARERGA